MSKITPEQAEEDILLFSNYLVELVKFARKVMVKRIRIRDGDHAGFMIWSFCAKMVYHAESLLVLREHNRERDMAALARTMIEGLGHLYWALDEPRSRPELWRAFAAVEDYRLAQREVAAGNEVPVEQRELIRSYLDQYGQHFLKGRKTRMPKLFTPGSENCFRHDWIPSVHQQAWKEVEPVKDLQEYFYGAYSRWLHWNAAGIGGFLRREGTTVSFVTEDPHARVAAIVIGCKCVRHVLIQMNRHFRLGIATSLNAVDRRCVGKRLGAP